MQWWLNLSMVDIDDLIPMAQVAEASGFAGISMGDHLVFPQTIATPYPYSSDGSVKWKATTHWPDPWVAMAAMAATTTRLRFTTGVYVAPLRNPFALAKSMSTVARMSGNRVIGGFGAGWMREEFDLVNEPFDARGARMDELIEVMRRLWTGEMVEYHGKIYDFAPIQMSPAVPDGIPIYVGGHNLAALKRVVRNQGWIGVHRNFEETGALVGKIRELGEGRRSDIMMNVIRVTEDDVARFVDLQVDAVVLPVLALPGSGPGEARLDAIRRAAERLALSPG